MMRVFITPIHSGGKWPTLRRRLTMGGVLLLMTALALVLTYPILLMFFTALKTEAELVRNPFGVPQGWAFHNFVTVWQEGRLGQVIINSCVVSLGVVVGTVGLSLLGGFALARLSFPAKNLWFIALTMGLVVPAETLAIPLFYMMKSLKLLNTHIALILPQVGLGLPFGMLLLRGFIQELPEEILDAARVDGCNLWQQFIHVVVPMVRPAAVALGVFQFIWSWNQYILPLVMIQIPSMRTVPLGLSFFVGRYTSAFSRVAAASVIASIPILVFYLIFHRQIVEARLAGALKG